MPHRRCSKTTGNSLCIVQIRLLQFSSHGQSQLCNSTNTESPKYCCTPHSQSSMPLKVHTSPTATPLAPKFRTNKIQNCLHVLCTMQSHVPLPLICLNYCTITVLPTLSVLRQTHACSNSNASTTNPIVFTLFYTLAPTSGTIFPKTSGNLSSFKSKLKRFLFSEYFS